MNWWNNSSRLALELKFCTSPATLRTPSPPRSPQVLRKLSCKNPLPCKASRVESAKSSAHRPPTSKELAPSGLFGGHAASQGRGFNPHPSEPQFNYLIVSGFDFRLGRRQGSTGLRRRDWRNDWSHHGSG